MDSCISKQEGNSNDEHDATNKLPAGAADMSRHVQDGTRMGAMTTEYVNIMEAARRCGVSDKTIRRWIHAKKLHARFSQPNRCEIAVSDLVPFLPGQSKETLAV
jgi:Helix-turn-helix domain